MSIGPTGHVGASAAGAPLSQTKSSENVRAAQEAAVPQHPAGHGKDVVTAAGIGQLAEDQQSSDRDPDGRRLWEREPPRREETDAQQTATPETDTEESGSKSDNNTGDPPAADVEVADERPRRVKDVHGQSGNRLDLTG